MDSERDGSGDYVVTIPVNDDNETINAKLESQIMNKICQNILLPSAFMDHL